MSKTLRFQAKNMVLLPAKPPFFLRKSGQKRLRILFVLVESSVIHRDESIRESIAHSAIENKDQKTWHTDQILVGIKDLVDMVTIHACNDVSLIFIISGVGTAARFFSGVFAILACFVLGLNLFEDLQAISSSIVTPGRMHHTLINSQKNYSAKSINYYRKLCVWRNN